MDYTLLADLLFPDIMKTPQDMEALYPPRNLPEGAVVTRMAPSPTGFVHLGNLVQGITAERLAHRSPGGVLYLRIEDTDRKREVSGAVKVLVEALRHYGIRFDEGPDGKGEHGAYGPYSQRVRKPIYQVYAKHLVAQGLAYPCFCTEKELSDMRERQKAQKMNFGYYGPWAVWRDRPLEDIEAMLAQKAPWVLRFKSDGNPANKHPFTDLVKGKIVVTENDMDQVLLKSDGIPTYHFAHAVDDHLMRTTHVIRADEWLASLPFHIQLFRALGFTLPKYMHIGPLMKMDGTSKRKLSKRKDPELALTYYQSEGFPVQSVYEYLLGTLNSNFEDWRAANPAADAGTFAFSAKNLNPAGSLFDYDKLCSVSKNVIAQMTAEEVYALLTEYAGQYDPEFGELLTAQPDYAKAILAIGRGGKKPRKDIAFWKQAKDYMDFFYDRYFELRDSFPDAADKNEIAAILGDYQTVYDPNDDQTVWFDKIKALSDKYGYASNMKDYKAEPERFKGSVADLSSFIRLAVTGKQNSPDMYSVMQVLGASRVRERIQKAIDILKA